MERGSTWWTGGVMAMALAALIALGGCAGSTSGDAMMGGKAMPSDKGMMQDGPTGMDKGTMEKK